MTPFSERQRAELRDAMARSRAAAPEEVRRIAITAAQQRTEQRERAQRAEAPVPQPPPLPSTDNGDLFAALADEALLASPEGQALLTRIDGATCDLYPDRDEHVRHVALLVLRAKAAHPVFDRPARAHLESGSLAGQKGPL